MIFRLLLIFLLISIQSFGQTINTDAPSMTPSAEVILPGVFQYEGRIQYTDLKGSSTLDLPLNLFRIGLTKRLELRTVNGLNAYSSYFSGPMNKLLFRNIELGFKYGIVANPERKIKMAFLAHYILPNPGKSKYQGANMAISVGHAIGERSSISYSVGGSYSVNQYANSDIASVITTLAYSNQLNERLSVFAEIYGTYSSTYMAQILEEDIGLNGDAGLYYRLKDNMQIDYTFGYGIDEYMYFHSLGFDIMIPAKKD